MQLENKVVIVTGAGSGIGAATAILCAANGAKVVVSDVNSANAQNVVNGIIEAGGNALVVKSDVTKYKDVENLINSTVGVFGRLDVIVNNAGIGPKRMVKVADHTLEDWDKVIAVNQTGVFYCMKLAIAQMLKNGGGNIVNVASLAGLKASGKNLSYSATA